MIISWLVLKLLPRRVKTTWRQWQQLRKEISPEYALEGLMLKLKLQYFGHPIRRTDSSEKTLILGKIEGRRRRKRQRMRWLDGITNSINGQEFEKALGVGDGQGSLACCSPWAKSWTELSNWTELNWELCLGQLLFHDLLNLSGFCQGLQHNPWQLGPTCDLWCVSQYCQSRTTCSGWEGTDFVSTQEGVHLTLPSSPSPHCSWLPTHWTASAHWWRHGNL